MGILSEMYKPYEGYAIFTIKSIVTRPYKDENDINKSKDYDLNMLLNIYIDGFGLSRIYIVGNFKRDENGIIDLKQNTKLKQLSLLISSLGAPIDLDRYGKFLHVRQENGVTKEVPITHDEMVKILDMYAQKKANQTYVAYFYTDKTTNKNNNLPFFYVNDENGRNRLASYVEFMRKNGKLVEKSDTDNIVVDGTLEF